MLTALCIMPALTQAQVTSEEKPTDEALELERIITSTSRAERALAREPASVSRVDGVEIERVAHTHVSELMYRVPGTWVTRNSGQEHLTAIRSPVLTGPGACGAFQFLEDGIPIRAAGFCNVNALFEVNTEQAGAVEVIRGPANALYGSNALHGTINVISRRPLDPPARQASLEAGPDRYWRGQVSGGGSQGNTDWRASATLTEDGGWRDDSGVSQQKLNTRIQHPLAGGELSWLFAGSWLDQDTAGFLEGFEAYRQRPTDNDNPEAFRKAEAQRLAARWDRGLASGWELEITPYLRRTDMDFLQHFLPGQPLEQNSQESLGLMNRLSYQGDRWWTQAGMDLEYTRSALSQYQDGEVDADNDFLRETRPPGAHYDYRVSAQHAAAYTQASRQLGERSTLEAGARLEYLNYDYRNRLEPGNRRDDGSECGFGGCLYTRPDDRSDSFTTTTLNLGLTRELGQDQALFTRLAQGYRAPQATELYRLQSGQTVADLDSEELDSVEAGLRGRLGILRYELAAYYMEKDNFIFRDSDGFNVSDGATRHRGIELDLRLPLSTEWSVALNASRARHTWAFDRTDGEPIERGDEISSAPRGLGSARLLWQPHNGRQIELAANYVGSHYLDNANERRYHGHTVFSLKASQALREDWWLHARVQNLSDRPHAERADFAFDEYRYFPGRDRSLFLALEYRR
ncbi:TonB-dependent receptor [Natronospira sp.]